MRHAYLASSKSKDASTKIGAVLVRDNRLVSEGYNGLPIGVNDDVALRHERPEKYFWFEHGERNAIFQCARYGVAAEGTRMYTQGLPCADCARAIIQAGVKEVIIHKEFSEIWEGKKQLDCNTKWMESHNRSKVMFTEASVEVREFIGHLDLTTRMNGSDVLV